jgi:hypothetical protein
LGTELAHVTIRGLSAATLAAMGNDPEDVTLVVCPLAEEADLITTAGRQVLALRTVRLPPEENDSASDRLTALVREIRRTLMAGAAELDGRPISSVAIFFSDPTLAERIRQETGLATRLVDPLVAAKSMGLGCDGVADSIAAPERLAGVLGDAVTMLGGRPLEIDFCHPRRRVEPQRVSRVHVLAAAAAVISLLAIGWYLVRQVSNGRAEAAVIDSEIAALEDLIENYTPVQDQAAAIDAWLATDVCWIEKLAWLSERLRPKPLSDTDFPEASDVVVINLTAGRPSGAQVQGGQLDLAAVCRSAAGVAELESRLRDGPHLVSGGGGQQGETLAGYPWEFDLQIGIAADALRDADALQHVEAVP